MRTKDGFVIVLDTVTGSSFIRMDELPRPLWDKIEPNDDDVKFRNASGKLVPTVGIVNITVPIRNSNETVHFLVADKLATAVILG